MYFIAFKRMHKNSQGFIWEKMSLRVTVSVPHNFSYSYYWKSIVHSAMPCFVYLSLLEKIFLFDGWGDSCENLFFDCLFWVLDNVTSFWNCLVKDGLIRHIRDNCWYRQWELTAAEWDRILMQSKKPACSTFA